MMSQGWSGKTIGGRYQVEALLGQGGMSAVYRALDPNLRRPVAIKVIHAHLATDPNFVGRFKEEAAAVARLRHPNIVQVHDFNVDGNTYYMVMEYLVGETLQTRLRRLNASGRRMSLEEALRLCIQLCEAAGYAHKRELVHRDIKPANIMLDVNGQAILMDFGIVKIIGGEYHTATGATIGTAMYMSPEQMRSERADERSDIYSLGVTLYEMLSGQPPYMADSALTLMMMVLNDPLPDLSELRQDIPKNLLAAVEKALAKDPALRFQTMDELATALRQVQADLASSPPRPAATVADEHPDGMAEQPAEQEIATIQEVTPAESLPAPTAPIESHREWANPATLPDTPGETMPAPAPAVMPAPAPPVRPDARRESRWARKPILLGALILVVLAVGVFLGILYLNAQKPPRTLLAPIDLPTTPVTDQTAQVVVSLGRWETGSSLEELAYSPDGSQLGTANNRDQTRFSRYRFFSGLWNVQPGSLGQYLLGHTQWVYDVAFSPDGRLLGSASDDGSLLLWQVSDGSLFQKIESAHGGLTSLAFSPNNLLLAAGSWDGILDLWQLDNGNLLRTLKNDDFSLKDVAFSPDGSRLAAASDNNAILVWQVSDGSLLFVAQDHTAPIRKVVFSPDGKLLASASEDRTVKIWQASDGSLLHTLQGPIDTVYGVAFSPDGSLLASASGDGTLRLWQVSDGTQIAQPGEYADGLKSVAFSPDGHLLVTGAADGVIQFWGISEAIPLDTP